MATNEEAFAQALQRFNGLVDTLDQFINGGEDESVTIAGLARPTLSRALKELSQVRGVVIVNLVNSHARALAIMRLYNPQTVFRVTEKEENAALRGFWVYDGTTLVRPDFVPEETVLPPDPAP